MSPTSKLLEMVCSSLCTDWIGCRSCQPTSIVKAMKHLTKLTTKHKINKIIKTYRK